MGNNEACVARGSGTNTLCSRNVPIIFVPGVMGTRLSRNGSAFWDPDNPSSMVGLLSASAGIAGIMLHADSRANVMVKGCKNAQLTAAESRRGWGGPAWSFYGQALRRLQDQANWSNVYAFGYDWRQSNAESGRFLKRMIRIVLNGLKARKVIIITHSMGGLVARWACKHGASAQVLGVIHVVQPAVGAVVAYRRFKTGARTSRHFRDGDPVFTRLIGNTAYKYARISHGLKGPYELLPSNHHPSSPYKSSHWLTWDKIYSEPHPPANIYDIYREPTGRFGLFRTAEDPYYARYIQRGINLGERFHQDLGVWFHNPTYVIAVRGHETDIGTHLKPDPSFFSRSASSSDPTEVDANLNGMTRRHYRAGDTTVPIGSQTALSVPSANQHVFNQTEAPAHAEVFKSNTVLNKIIEFVNRILSS